MSEASAQDLTTLGEKAAHLWASKRVPTLTMGAAQAIKTASFSLNREQMTRVVEATNHAAYQQTHNQKLAGAGHRYVDFVGGPARVEDVVKQATGLPEPVTYRDLSDYTQPPTKAPVKLASLEQLFGVEKFAFSADAEGPPADGMFLLRQEQIKLAGLRDNVQGILDMEESSLDRVRHQLVGEMKLAHMEGATLNDIVRAMTSVDSRPEMTKVAFRLAHKELMASHTPATFATSLKTASAGVLDPAHDLLSTYREFAVTATKVAALREAVEEMEGGLQAIRDAMKLAADAPPAEAASIGTHIRDAMKGYSGFADTAGKNLGEIASGVVGGAGKHIGGAAALGMKAVPFAVGGALAYRGLQHARAAMDSPLGRTIQSFIPGTDEHRFTDEQIRMNYGAPSPYMGGY